MNDELVLRHFDERNNVSIYAPPDLVNPEFYIYVVWRQHVGMVVQTRPNINQTKMYAEVISRINKARAKVRAKNKSIPQGVPGEAVVVAWSGDMKDETLRRLAAVEMGAGSQLSKWSSTRPKNKDEMLLDALLLQSKGPDHMTRVKALIKLAYIYMAEPCIDEEDIGGVRVIASEEWSAFELSKEEIDAMHSRAALGRAERERGNRPPWESP